MKIPVMHDDQHGTAIISGAALLNALELAKKKITEVKFVVSGAGAAAVSCTRMYTLLGAKKENIVMLDKAGPLNKSRTDLDPVQMEFATDRTIKNLAEAMVGADVFIGLSAGNLVSQEMIKSMAANPIVFALANPTPEIDYNLAVEARPDILMATGRSDHPNQVNNVLGFPYIFRGALDVRATEINETMKLAAVKALAELTKEPVPDIVNKAYGDDTISFGRDYFIPKPLDPRLITTLSPAIAKAAMESGVAKIQITDWEAYTLQLQQRLGIDHRLMSRVIARAKQNPKRVVFAEAEHYKILKAAQILVDEGIATPVLLGNKEKIQAIIKENGLSDLDKVEIIEPYLAREKRIEYGELLYQKRYRKGLEKEDGRKLMRDKNYFGAMMVETGEADALISGLTTDYATTIRPALQVIGVADGVNRVAGMYILISKKGTYFFSDTTVNVNPNAEELVEIIGLTADMVRFFDSEPRIALMSYSNFGSSKGETPDKMALVRKLAKKKYPDLKIEGEMQANIAVNKELQKENYPFSELAEEGANTLIFPGLASGNISYKLLQEVGNNEAIGPILMGMRKPVHVLQMGSSVREIVNMVAIAVVEAQKLAMKN